MSLWLLFFEVPDFQKTIQVQIEQYNKNTQSDELVSLGYSFSSQEELFDAFSYENEPDCFLKLVA